MHKDLHWALFRLWLQNKFESYDFDNMWQINLRLVYKCSLLSTLPFEWAQDVFGVFFKVISSLRYSSFKISPVQQLFNMACIPIEAYEPNNSTNGTDDDYEYSMDYNDTIDEKFKAEQEWYRNTEYIIDRYVTHYIALVGIIGNLINLVVLSRRSLTAHMGRLEKSSHIGLIALAVSDFLYCMCSFPQAWNDHTFSRPSISFWLVYDTYGTACINCFLLSSSWLTMSMAVCRYLAICHPLRARQYLGMTASRTIIIVVFCLSILFNLPRFWMKQINHIDCMGGGKLYFHMPGYMQSNDVAHIAYSWLYFIFGILLPLVVLAYCNIFLIKAIQSSHKLRREHSSDSTEATRIVTLTLCIIVVMYIVLVGPAELVTFWKPFVSDNALQYGLAVRICNSLQMLNFAVNFILYCIINVHFRQVIRELLLCQHFRSHRHSSLRKLTDAESHTQETSAMLWSIIMRCFSG